MFWESFWPNFASDLLAGVILGALVTLVIQNWQNIGGQRKTRLQVLTLIKKELTSNYNSLEKRVSGLVGTGFLSLPGLKNEYWNVIARTDSLLSIAEDHLLMERLSKAYHLIDTIRQVERTFYSAMAINGLDSKSLEPLKNDLKNGYSVFKEYMGKLNEWGPYQAIPYEFVAEEEIFRNSDGEA